MRAPVHGSESTARPNAAAKMRGSVPRGAVSDKDARARERPRPSSRVDHIPPMTSNGAWSSNRWSAGDRGEEGWEGSLSSRGRRAPPRAARALVAARPLVPGAPRVSAYDAESRRRTTAQGACPSAVGSTANDVKVLRSVSGATPLEPAEAKPSHWGAPATRHRTTLRNPRAASSAATSSALACSLSLASVAGPRRHPTR